MKQLKNNIITISLFFFLMLSVSFADDAIKPIMIPGTFAYQSRSNLQPLAGAPSVAPHPVRHGIGKILNTAGMLTYGTVKLAGAAARGYAGVYSVTPQQSLPSFVPTVSPGWNGRPLLIYQDAPLPITPIQDSWTSHYVSLPNPPNYVTSPPRLVPLY